MTSSTGPRRLLWNEPRVVAAGAVALLITAGISVMQMSMRANLFDPASVPIFERLFLFQDYNASLLFPAVLLLALSPQCQSAGSAIARWMGRHALITTTTSCLAFAAGAWFVYLNHPLSLDESAPLMQSQAFAAGSLLGRFPPALIDWLVYPPFQEMFIHVSHETGEVSSAYWPGFAALLTPFTAAGVPWLCNPVLGALAVWVIYRITLHMTGSMDAAGAAMLFSLASAAFVINSISYYSMTAHMLCNAVFVLLLLEPTPRRALLAGLVGGLALNLHNPFPHMLFALPWLAWLLSRDDRWRLVPSIVAGYLPGIAAGFGWYLMTHGLSPNAPNNAVAAGGGPIEIAVRQFLAVLRFPDAALLDMRVMALAKLWLWAVPALVLLTIVGFWRSRAEVRFKLLAASAILTFVGYVFIPVSQGHGWGFRYFHSAWFVLPVLAAGAIAGPTGHSIPPAPRIAEPLTRYVYGAALGSLVLLLPLFAWQVHSFIQLHIGQLPTSEQGRPRVVIINPYMGYYSQDLVQNDPFLRTPVIRMITHGRANDEKMMATHFPDLVVLSRGYRGSVWGYPDDDPTSTSNGTEKR